MTDDHSPKNGNNGTSNTGLRGWGGVGWGPPGLRGLRKASAAPSVRFLKGAVADCSWLWLLLETDSEHLSPGLIVSMTQLTPLISIKVHIHALYCAPGGQKHTDTVDFNR